MNCQEASELLDLIAARAPALRAAGVRCVELDGVAFTLAPPEPPDPAPVGRGTGEQDDEPRDALHDPATHGLFGDEAPRRMERHRRPPLIPERDE